MKKISPKEKLSRMHIATRLLGSTVVDAEWEYFQEYARNFSKDEPDKNKHYGILIQGAEHLEENMIYANDPGILRMLHLEALAAGRGGSVGAQLRTHLDWLERLEGKT